MSDEAADGKPQDDRMRGGQTGVEDPIGEIAVLAGEPGTDDEILRKLEEVGATLSTEEIFSVLVRYDTPDVLG